MRNAAGLLLVGLYCATSAVAAEPVDYLKDVKPLFASRCYACHGALKQESGLRLDTAALARAGGDSGPAVVPGKSSESLLIHAVTGAEGMSLMPAEGKPLVGEEIALLSAWIDAGATGPPDEEPQPDPREHWAFKAPLRPAVPAANSGGRAHNPIDAFIAAEHERHGLVPSPPADKHILLRRVYLDLIGLPPTRAELRSFLADDSPDAYERVVDRLLSSPRYGERWGRHWMDVWRYSDWYGRRAVPDVMNSYPQIWRWRDWIVRSLNQDVGYDRMIVEMLAADEASPQDDAALPATGFVVRNWYKWNYHSWMKDAVEHTGKAFLGLTLNCCHCHDHKYDPITQEEYFKFRAFFEPLELRHDRVAGEPDPGPFKKYVYAESYGPIASGMVRVFDENLAAETYMYSGGDARNRIEGQAPVNPGAPAVLGGDRLKVDAVDLPPAAWYPGLKPFVQEEERQKRNAAVATAERALAEARVVWEQSQGALAAEVAAAELGVTAAKSQAGETPATSNALAGAQSLLLDAASGRRVLAHYLPEGNQVAAAASVSFMVRILRDSHTNLQLGLDVAQGATGGYVAFENGKILTYRPGGFETFEAGKYELAGGQDRFRVTLALDPANDRMALTVKSLGDDATLVDGAAGALNGWKPAADGKRGLFIDARPGSVALFDEIVVADALGEPLWRFDFEPPRYADGQELADAEGWLALSFSLPPASSKVVSAIARDSPPSPAAQRLQAARHKQEAARLAVAAAEARLAAAQADRDSIAARIAADNARYSIDRSGLSATGPNVVDRSGLPATGPNEVDRPGLPATADAIRSAARAERAATLALAEANQAAAEAALAAAEAKESNETEVQAAQAQLAAARTAVEAARADLTAEPAEYTPLSPQYPRQSTGRRLALARWIAAGENPLTARVAVNHIWLRHFGRALVETTFNFGTSGKRPTHPELLDWLAVEFMEHSWSMKHLHRLLVTSQAYRLRSNLVPASRPNVALDADNAWLWRFNPSRMQAEAIRDSVLHLAGDLDPALGGHEIEHEQGLTSRRRSIYFAHHGESKMEFLELFDAANPCDCYERSTSVQPQQALALANSELSLGMARALAGKLWQTVAEEPADPEEAKAAFVSAAFEQVLARSPTAEERAVSLAFLRRQAQLFPTASSQAVEPAAAAATSTGPAADPDARAREGLVHALFSHNDFVRIR